MRLIQRILSIGILITTAVHAQTDADTTRIRNHLLALTQTETPRNYKHPDQLNHVAAYIHAEFESFADTTFYQSYEVNGVHYRNVIARFGKADGPRIIVGAHYDVCGNQEGADDNASGISGLLELARLLDGQTPERTIELVAYTLEEPPYFRTNYMGSYIHAKKLSEEGVEVVSMISLEMIGFFRDEKHSQDYPIGLLRLFYGSRGNYITLVNKLSKGKGSRIFTRTMKRSARLPVKKFNGPKKLTGIDFSDHLNYWKFGFSACMVTDTAFYRNKNYHQYSDQIGTLDLNRMKLVIDGVFFSILNLK